jgi:hypothetical protein
LLPMRATFGALGASVRYDPHGRIIVARTRRHALRLQIGAPRAIVDGRRVALDVPARVIANRTYVPLRFAAEALGADVGFDARASIVSIVVPHYARAIVSSNAGQSGVKVLGLTPAPDSVVASAYPAISASLSNAAAGGADVTLTLDGANVTTDASFDGTTITYMPRAGLSRGTHTVAFSGRALSGEEFSASWNFDTSLEAPPDAPAFNLYQYQFYSEGLTAFYPGDWMHFVLIAPPGGSAELQLCGLGYQYALWNNGYGGVYEANFPAPYGYWLPACAVTAKYFAWNGRQYFVPIPVMVGIFTQRRAQPVPTSSPRPVPGSPRRREPTPAPTARPAPVPTAAPAPTPTSAPTAAPTHPPMPPRTPHPRPVPRPTA